MAFFKFRKGPAQVQTPVQPVAVDLAALRTRARNRLLGAVSLVLVAGVVLGLAFDREPRKVPLDARIVVVEPNAVPGGAAAPATAPVVALAAPLASGATPAARLQAAASADLAADAPLTGASTSGPKPVPVVAQSPTSSPVLTELKQPATPVQIAQVAPEKIANKSSAPGRVTPPTGHADEAGRALALLQGHTPQSRAVPTPPSPAPARVPATPADKMPAAVAAPVVPVDAGSATAAHAAASAPADAARRVVQVGAFSDAARVKEVRAKLERAGLKTYAQAVDTAAGRRVRVRLGPYASRAEADKAAARVKKLGLPAAVLTL